MQPFLKWPGGKRWLAANSERYFPQDYNHYFEPFLGSGSVFFTLLPVNATISDINEELINLYTVMRDQPIELQDEMRRHQELHCNEYYYTVREQTPISPLKRAGRMLYLNRTCYNGMYRVNRDGMFNVPIGTKNNCIYDIDQFENYSNALRGAELLASDFSAVIDRANEGDLIFADPPYTMSKKSGFIKYNQRIFSWADQNRLLSALNQAKERRVKIVITNANCQEIKDLYALHGYTIHTHQRSSTISSQVEKRTTVDELIITSF